MLGCLFSILGGPFLGSLVESITISRVLLGDSLIEGRGNVGLSEHLSNDGQNFSDFELRRPDSLQNLLADLTSLLLDVRVIGLSEELDRRSLERILRGDSKFEVEFTSLKRSLGLKTSIFQFKYETKGQ